MSEKHGNFIFRIAALVAIVLFVSACGGVKGKPQITSFSFPHVMEIESQHYNPEHSDDTIGLALSGGGARSASFNIGVLAGLNSISTLRELDVISTVSGGSYAAFWYYSKLYYLSRYAKDTHDDIFKCCYSNAALIERDYGDKPENEAGADYRFQKHLRNNSLILKKYSLESDSGDKSHFGHFAPIVCRAIVEAPTSNVLELFGSENNSLSARDYYREGIERTYGLYPDKKNETGRMDGDFLGQRNSSFRNNGHKFRAESIYLSSLQRELYNKKEGTPHAPVWVINTTVAPYNDFRFRRLYDDPISSEPFAKSIYEITPFTIGSGTTEYMTVKEADQMRCNLRGDGEMCLRTVSDYVALSGAAVDVTPYTDSLGRLGLTLMSFAGIELGDYSINPKDLTDPAYLSDGGHSDNLGAYSLIKRGIKNIIISDAEADKYGQIQGLRRLQKHLEEENKQIVFYKDANRTIPNDDLNKCLGEEDTQCLTIAYDGNENAKKAEEWELLPILHAHIKSFNGDVLSKVYYIKLRALDSYVAKTKDGAESGYPQYPPSTQLILVTDRDPDKFPHVSTVDVNFNPTQHFIYFTLGRFYGNALKDYLNKNAAH